MVAIPTPLMRITRTSQVSGITRSMDLPITQKQIDDWKNGMFVQDAFPNLNADEREFFMTGITPDEWDRMFPPREDDDDGNPYDESNSL